MTVENVVALVVFAVLVVAAYRITTRPGGPMMFGLVHPRIAVVLAFGTLAIAATYLVGGALGDLPRDSRPAFGEYLVRLSIVGFLCGSVVVAIGLARRPRNARQAAANLRLLGSSRFLWTSVALWTVLGIMGEWFNPVPMARFGVSGSVAAFGFGAPYVILVTVRAFFFPSTLPSVPAIAQAFAGDPTDAPGLVSSHDIPNAD